MSGWDGYVNDMMKNTGLFDNASILSKEDYGEWATTDGFSVRTKEWPRLAFLHLKSVQFHWFLTNSFLYMID